MPIQYRCPGCDQLLSIATRKAGEDVPCPRCGLLSTVPGQQPPTQPPMGDEPKPVSWREPVAPPRRASVVESADEEAFNRLPTAEQTAAQDQARVSIGPSSLVPTEPDGALSAIDTGARHVANPAAIERDDSDAPDLSHRESDDDEVVDAGGFKVRRASPDLGDLDLTSMVDVTFLLLIFFMVTASFSLQKTIEVPAPQPDQQGAAQSLTLEEIQANTIFVRIDEQNAIFVDDTPAGPTEQLEEVLTRVQRTTQRTELAIDAHPDAYHERVVQVIDAATAAGLQKVRILSRAGRAD